MPDITYTAAGTYTPSWPVGAEYAIVKCWGAGGGGKGSGSTGSRCSGGGGGAFSQGSSVLNTGNITVTVGAGGPGGAGAGSGPGNNGTTGGDTKFEQDVGGVGCLAKGGTFADTGAGSGGAAGSGVGDIKYSGGNGGTGATGDPGGGGGAAAGTTLNGNPGEDYLTTDPAAGGVGIGGGGSGGNGGDINPGGGGATGKDGQAPGGGGGGANAGESADGGDGADGRVEIDWFYASESSSSSSLNSSSSSPSSNSSSSSLNSSSSSSSFSSHSSASSASSRSSDEDSGESQSCRNYWGFNCCDKPRAGGCAACPDGWYACWSLIVSGVTDISFFVGCENLNGTHILRTVFAGGCRVDASLFSVLPNASCATAAFLGLAIVLRAAIGGFELTFNPGDGPIVTYFLSYESWDCFGPNTLTRQSTACCNWPATLTVEPSDC